MWSSSTSSKSSPPKAIITKFALQHFARNRLLSLHDACVSVTSAPKQSKIEKSFEKYKSSSRNRRNWLSSIIAPSSAGYGKYIVDPKKPLFSVNYSSSAAQMDPNSEFLTAINNNRNQIKKMKMMREYEDLPRHVPRHVVQPLQEAPHSPSSPIANFSLIPLFAVSENHYQVENVEKSEHGHENHESSSSSSVSSLALPEKSFPEWMPRIELSRKKQFIVVHPSHVLPKKIKPVNGSRQDSESCVLVDGGKFFENTSELKFVIGYDDHDSSSSSSVHVSFLQLAIPLPASLQELVNNNTNSKMNNSSSSSISVKFWTQKFNKARLLRPNSASFFNLQESAGLWWYFVWMHRNYSIHWLIDINHLFSSSSSTTSNFENEEIKNKNKSPAAPSPRAKRKFFLPSPDHELNAEGKSNQKHKKNLTLDGEQSEINLVDENNESNTNSKNIKSGQVLSQLLTTFTARPVRDADNFGQRESRKKSRYEKYDIGSKRRKGNKMKKASSVMKRRLQLHQQQQQQQSNNNHNQNQNKNNSSASKKFSSAQEYILHRLAVKFSLLNPHQLRLLVDHYRLFLHHCHVSFSNERRLWKDAADSNEGDKQAVKKIKNNKKNIKKQQSIIDDELSSSLTHASIQLPQEVYVEEMKVWREWRFVYSFFPIFALKAAMFGSGLPLQKVGSTTATNNTKKSSTLAKVLGFDFIITENDDSKKNKNNTTSNSSSSVGISNVVSFPSTESSSRAFERISATNVMSSGLHPTLSSSSSGGTSFLLDPKSLLHKNKSSYNKNKQNSAIIKKYHLSTELSKLELALLKTRSGYWVFRNSLPAIDPQIWWKHFVISTTTCAQKWDTLTGQQRTLFDTLPMKRKSGERRSDPFFVFLRQRVAEASALRKAQIEMRKKERRLLKKQNQSSSSSSSSSTPTTANDNGNNNKDEEQEDQEDFEKFPFLSTETNLPTTLGRVCALARKDWNNMHPFEQAQYYDQDAIKQTFPDFDGFKKEDAALWKSLIEEEEQRQKMLDQMELEERWSLHDNFYSDDYFLSKSGINENTSHRSSTTSSVNLMMRLKNDDELAAKSSIMIASTSGNGKRN